LFYKDGDNYYLYPQTIIPPPTSEKFEIGKRAIIGDRPWTTNGQDWHLEKRCGKVMKEKLIQLNAVVAEHFPEVDGPNWDQKFYVSYKVGSHIWFSVHTHKTALILYFEVDGGEFNSEQISKELGIKVFDRTSSLSEKLQKESSVGIETIGEHDRIVIRIKDEFDVSSEQFLKFMKTGLDSFKKYVSA
jgi:hypothetical protein